jgi:ABC-type multidrug transport system fused ATPase/permease subunit
MEDGYETMLGEKGTRLSGGQRQRIALTRAFLRGAPILVIDEGTSALDSENESLIQKELMRHVENKTVFIIAHRFATLEIVNRILVLHEGVVVGDGTNDELLESCDLYRELRALQFFGEH